MTDPNAGRRSDGQSADQCTPSTTRRRFLGAAGAGAAGATLGLGVTGTATAAGIPTPWLERDGNLLRDPEGNEVVLRGVNIADPKRLNDTDRRYHVSEREIVRRATDVENDWYSRVIRLPCQPGDIVGSGKNEVEPGVMSQSDVEEYLENHLRPAVEECAEQGAYAIVDYHRHEDGQLLYTDDELDEEVQMFWETIAPEFAEDSHVLYEVYNEPIAPYPGHNEYGQNAGVDVASPEAEDTWLTWRDVAQDWVDVIRDHAPRNVVIVGSPRWTQWTYWADEHEFQGENLAYAGHVYAHQNLRPLSTYFGKPAENVPVFMTEFGYDDEGQDFLKGTTSVEGEEFREFFEEYDSVHWQVWCFDPRWEPAMFEEDQGEWTLLGGEDYHGEFFKEYLYEKRNDDVPGGGGEERPDPPQALEVVDTAQTSVTVEWAAVDGVDGYAVYLEGESYDTTEETTATVDGLEPDTTYEIAVASTLDGRESLYVSITATPGGELPCVGADGGSLEVDGQIVCDVDDDGYFRDVNGDVRVGNRDVGAFFENFHFDAWDREEFDYSGNGRVSHGDVVALFDHVV